MRNRVQTLSTHKGNDGGVVRKLSATRVDIPNLADNCLIEQKTIPRTDHSLSSYGLLAIFVRVIFPFLSGFFLPLSRGLEQEIPKVHVLV
jgi:hypothetical protein